MFRHRGLSSHHHAAHSWRLKWLVVPIAECDFDNFTRAFIRNVHSPALYEYNGRYCSSVHVWNAYGHHVAFSDVFNKDQLTFLIYNIKKYITGFQKSYIKKHINANISKRNLLRSGGNRPMVYQKIYQKQ